jgi:hypothetical protein
MGQAHRYEPTKGRAWRTVPVVQSDPTGFSSPIGQLIVAGMLLAVLVVLIRWWREQNKR